MQDNTSWEQWVSSLMETNKKLQDKIRELKEANLRMAQHIQELEGTPTLKIEKSSFKLPLRLVQHKEEEE